MLGKLLKWVANKRGGTVVIVLVVCIVAVVHLLRYVEARTRYI